jgi:hypothetical protein
MRILGNDVVRRRFHQRAEGGCLSCFGVSAVSLAGSAFFKSHRHKGQRVATENTMRPKATHSLLGQTLILDPPKHRKHRQLRKSH